MTTWRSLKNFLLGPTFKRQLARRYERFEILAEGGLRTAVAQVLRSKLRQLKGSAQKYRVTCETQLGEVVPDILIWKNRDPVIAIELKDTRLYNRASADADWKKLKAMQDSWPTIKRAFTIYVARKHRRGADLTPIARDRTTLRMWPVVLFLEDFIGGFQRWNGEYKRRKHYVDAGRKSPKDKAALTKKASAGR